MVAARALDDFSQQPIKGPSKAKMITRKVIYTGVAVLVGGVLAYGIVTSIPSTSASSQRQAQAPYTLQEAIDYCALPAEERYAALPEEDRIRKLQKIREVGGRDKDSIECHLNGAYRVNQYNITSNGKQRVCDLVALSQRLIGKYTISETDKVNAAIKDYECDKTYKLVARKPFI